MTFELLCVFIERSSLLSGRRRSTSRLRWTYRLACRRTFRTAGGSRLASVQWRQCALQVNNAHAIQSSEECFYCRDRWNQTPLLSAVHGGHITVIKRLRRAGAHITLSTLKVGVELCMAAAQVHFSLHNCKTFCNANEH